MFWPLSTAAGRFCITRPMAFSAKASLTGLRCKQLAASMAWHKASMPVLAVMRGGRLAVMRTSSTAASGRRW